MKQFVRIQKRAVFVGLALLVVGCAGLEISNESEIDHQVTYVVADDNKMALARRYAPIFLVKGQDKSFNRIGTPAAKLDESGHEEIYVDSSIPTVYFQRQKFSTGRGNYLNLVYRVHFEQVPFSLAPFHLTAGKNGGIIVVITLNDQGEPVLTTMVHTCGCYLAIIPSTYLPSDAYPVGWNIDGQKVFGVRLPGLLDFKASNSRKEQLQITIRGGNHRVLAVKPVAKKVEADAVSMVLRPVADLYTLPLGESTTSFFETEGPWKGYVKDAGKPLEMLLMGWWSLDLQIGEDKALGPAEQTGVVFYTSLKPWARNDSDMWQFVDFLQYWGWNL